MEKNEFSYHRRSLVETKMHCIKLLGDKLSARSFDSQVNEIHARVAVLKQIYGIRSTTYPSYALKFGSIGALCISNLCNKADHYASIAILFFSYL